MRIAIAGCSGHINYVLAALAADPTLKIAAFAAFPEENPQSLLERMQVMGQEPTLYDNWEDMLAKGEYDVVAAGAPFSHNAGITLRALEKGLPVFSDKPLGLTMDSLSNVAEAARAANKPVCAMMGLRCDPYFAAAKKAVDEGAVGKIVMMTAQKSYRVGTRTGLYSRRETYGGTIPWIGIHAVDWLYWYGGQRFARVTAGQSLAGNGGNGTMESSALMLFTLRDGGLAGANIDYLRPVQAPTHGDDRVRIAGTEGVLEVSHSQAKLIRNDAPEKALAPLQIPGGIFGQFTRYLRGEGENPLSTRDGVYISAASLLARESADRGQTIDFEEYGW